MKPTLREFFAGSETHAWLCEPGLNVYVGVGLHPIHGVYRQTFDIVNAVAKRKGRGTFANFLAKVEHSLPKHYAGICVENVFAKRFQAFFTKKGYKRLRSNAFGITYYKPRSPGAPQCQSNATTTRST